MFLAGPLALTVTLMGWGPLPTVPAEIPAAEAPPAVEEPTPAPPPPALVNSPPAADNYRTPAPPPVIYVYPPEATEVRWYGWQLVLADAGSLFLMVEGGTPGLVVGMGGLVLGAPALHFANHNYGTGAASLAVRGGVVLLIAGIASDKPPPCPMSDPLCPVGHAGGAFVDAGIAIGLLLGGMVFVVVDDLALARVTVPRRPAPGLAPFVAPRAGGASLGLSGRF
jgi:hypothetical protein